MTETDAREAPNPLRTTFLPGAEILQRVRQLLGRAIERLQDSAGERPERGQLFRESLVSLLERLVVALQRFEAGAPQELLESRTQYSLELPSELEPPESWEIEHTARWVLALTGPMRELFHQLAESSSEETLREAYLALEDLVLVHEKRISTLEAGAGDV